MLESQASVVVRMQSAEKCCYQTRRFVQNICFEHVLKSFCAKANRHGVLKSDEGVGKIFKNLSAKGEGKKALKNVSLPEFIAPLIPQN